MAAKETAAKKTAEKETAKASPKGAAVAQSKPQSAKPEKEKAVAVAEPAPVAKALLLKAHQVVLRPLVTEKGMHRSTRNNAYAFEVSRQATKDDIRHAVEE